MSEQSDKREASRAVNGSAGANRPVPLCDQVEDALRLYFQQLDGHQPASLYKMVLREVEPPLLRTVLRYTEGNQTRAAEILGLDRSTLRKKLKQYALD